MFYRQWQQLTVTTALLLANCAGSSEPHGYLVMVEIQGSQSAFMDRTITVNGRVMRPAVQSGNVWATAWQFCTNSRDHFLNGPVRVRVDDAEGLVSESSVELVACRFSEEEVGYEQWLTLYLEEDGTIAADVGNDPRVSSYCDTPQEPPPVCEPDDFSASLE